MKTKIFSGFIALVLFLASPAIAQTNQSGADDIVAKGNGFIIKRNQLDDIINSIKQATAMNQKPLSADQLKSIESQTLKRMIQIQILLTLATDADKAAGKADADKQLTSLILRAGSAEEFNSKLKAVGMSSETFRTKITQEATAAVTLTRKLDVTVSDAEAKKYYDDHPEDFTSAGGGQTEFTSVEAKIKDFLIRQKTNELAPAYLDKLYNAANVQILDASLK